MILLWGIPSDPPLAAIERILKRDRVPFSYLDQRAILDTELTGGTLRVNGDTLQLEEVTAVYPRPYDLALIKPVADAGADSAEWKHATAFQQDFSIWLDLTPALVLNRPREMALNYSKPYQATLIEAAGFRIPETLITTDPAAARDFQKTHHSIIYKSISALRSIVSQLTPEDEARLESVSWCPTQFQRRITGPEVRVHVIRDQIFAAEIVSDADDYRYTLSLKIRPYDLPEDCAAKCRKMSASMNFVIAGLDLRCENGI